MKAADSSTGVGENNFNSMANMCELSSGLVCDRGGTEDLGMTFRLAGEERGQQIHPLKKTTSRKLRPWPLARLQIYGGMLSKSPLTDLSKRLAG